MERPLPPALFVGLEVAKDRLGVHLQPSGQAPTVEHTDQGWAHWTAALPPLAPTVILLEAIGGFEVTVTPALARADPPLAMVNPHQVRAFARAVGRPTRTDRLDAELIADRPALGRVDRRRLTAFVGVAPLNCDSGQLRGLPGHRRQTVVPAAGRWPWNRPSRSSWVSPRHMTESSANT